MCDSHGPAAEAAAATPRSAQGLAVDPIGLAPVDEVIITTLVDNVFDALLASDDRTSRASFGVGRASAPQFESGLTNVGLRAEHGFSALVTVRRGESMTTRNSWRP